MYENIKTQKLSFAKKLLWSVWRNLTATREKVVLDAEWAVNIKEIRVSVVENQFILVSGV